MPPSPRPRPRPSRRQPSPAARQPVARSRHPSRSAPAVEFRSPFVTDPTQRPCPSPGPRSPASSPEADPKIVLARHPYQGAPAAGKRWCFSTPRSQCPPAGQSIAGSRLPSLVAPAATTRSCSSALSPSLQQAQCSFQQRHHYQPASAPSLPTHRVPFPANPSPPALPPSPAAASPPGQSASSFQRRSHCPPGRYVPCSFGVQQHFLPAVSPLRSQGIPCHSLWLRARPRRAASRSQNSPSLLRDDGPVPSVR
mmetsp:Transcript_26053/g.55424  ORF Transcript_26053/g.55424 Transcript_26053/m.55424 type:complete len:253 (-) Transcript_26053:676-1434(-)